MPLTVLFIVGNLNGLTYVEMNKPDHIWRLSLMHRHLIFLDNLNDYFVQQDSWLYEYYYNWFLNLWENYNIKVQFNLHKIQATLCPI